MAKVPLPGSAPPELPGLRLIGAPSPDERFSVSVILRPRSHGSNGRPLLWPPKQTLSREQYAAEYGADPQHVAQVEALAESNNLSVEQIFPVRRTVISVWHGGRFIKGLSGGIGPLRSRGPPISGTLW